MSHPRNITDEYPMEAMLASSPQTTVYQAADATVDRKVVVKLLSPLRSNGTPVQRQHFLRAMGAVQFLRLPAFPELFDFGFNEDHSAFMVMEWVNGPSLAEVQDRPPDELLPILVQVVDALEALAMGEVFHHNLSPSNILLASGTNGPAAKIVGFGTAAFFSQTTAGNMLGHSPDGDSYMAPERLDPNGENDEPGALSDIYSLGLIATELLGGTIEGGDSGPTVHFDSTARSGLRNPDHLANVLGGALHMQAEDRTTSYPLLRVAFESALAESDHAAPETEAEERSLSETVVVQPPPIPTPAEDSTIVSQPPDQAAPDADLDDTAKSFDPNKTDPVILPEELAPPPIVASSPPAGADSRVHRKRKRLLLLGVIAAAVVVVSILGGGILLLLHLTSIGTEPEIAEAVAPSPVPATPTPQPAAIEPVMHAALEQADVLLAAGDVEGARSVLSTITQVEKDNFADEELELYDGIVAALTGSRLEAAITDLEGGLRHGSVRMLKRAVAGFSRIDSSAYSDRPEIGRKLAKAQAALDIHGRLWEAHDKGDHAETLEQAALMINALPDYSTSYTFRQEAAAALEAESDAAAMAGDLDEAADLLEPINAFWPSRDGLKNRIAAITTSRDLTEAQLAIIEDALSRGWDGDPAAGLEILRSTTPTPLLEQRFAKTKTLLEEQLAGLDAQPPQIELHGDSDLSFKKKKTVTVEVVITDDHRVKDTAAFVRVSGAASFEKLPLERASAANTFHLIVTPDIHRNEDFSVYFEASDISGQTSRLGDPQKPLEFTRKKGLKAIFSK